MYTSDDIKKELMAHGFIVTNIEDDVCFIDGNGIEGAIWCENGKRYNKRIIADNIKCFEKWQKCPLNLPFPENKKQLKFLIDRLRFWGTDEGSNLSDEYDIDSWTLKYLEG